MALPRMFAAAQGPPGRCKHRPLQGTSSGFAPGIKYAPIRPPCQRGRERRSGDCLPAKCRSRGPPHRSDSKPGCSHRRGVRRDEGIPPYGRPGGRGHPGRPQHPPRFVGADSISAREPSRRNRHTRICAGHKICPNQAPLSKGAGCGQSPQTGGLPSARQPPPVAPP